MAPPLAALAGVGMCVLLAAAIKYTDQWEKAVLLRLGRYRGLRGPGYFAVVPIIDRVAYTQGRAPAIAAGAPTSR